MKCLIVLAHPEPRSFNGALARVAQDTLRQYGHDVRVSDLYARRFLPDEHARHFGYLKNPTRFDAQTEQRFNADQQTLPHDVLREINDLLWADFVIFQFPLWWFGMPAILKGWMDRVFTYGKLYSSQQRLHTGVCSGKRTMLSVTAGSSADSCSYNGQEGDTHLILWPIKYSLHYVGFTVLETTLITGVRGGLGGEGTTAQDHYLAEQLEAYSQRLSNLESIPVIRFNTADDWDERRKLKPGAPVYSPFIRHEPKLRVDRSVS